MSIIEGIAVYLLAPIMFMFLIWFWEEDRKSRREYWTAVDNLVDALTDDEECENKKYA